MVNNTRVNMVPCNLFLVLLAVFAFAPAVGAQTPTQPPEEAEYYKIITLPIPENLTLEVGAMEIMPDGKTLAVATRRGDVYMVSGAFKDPPKGLKFSKWAHGLHEILGLAFNPKDGFLYAVQRAEVTRLKDTDNDKVCDVYETFCDEWGVSGDYHEYPIGSKFDKEGNLFVTLCLTGSFTSDAPFRGWCMKITPDGEAVPYASGIRSPAGMGFNAEGELFYCDNQGPWNGTSSLKHIEEGSFQGHPIGNKWYELAKNLGPQPIDPQSGSRFHIEMQKIKEYNPPAVLLPHGKIGQAASGIQTDFSDGKFGPFKNHLFVNDQHHSNITRCVLEKVNGYYQGVAIPFVRGFTSGNVPIDQAPDGSMFVGGTNRGWGSIGPKEWALERVVWTGKVPFELFDMKIQPDGFELTFTEPVEKTSAGSASSYNMTTYTYLFQAEYGSPEIDTTTPTIKSATVSEDGLKVKLVVDGLQIGHVHELKLDGVRSGKNAEQKLLHPVAYYTLWQMPKE